MKRAVVFVALAAVWVPLGLLWQAGRFEPDTVGELQQQLDNPQQMWASEDLYYTIANWARGSKIGTGGGVQNDQTGDAERVRILVIGDSYTFVVGLRDLNMRWGQQL